jgi:hypothetical protein
MIGKEESRKGVSTDGERINGWSDHRLRATGIYHEELLARTNQNPNSGSDSNSL